ncbi:PaaI family thioesterase [Yinghuangia seranimata]|uniref:PaaI family thioesterase n=1 Tax=Yinghuangia seranimata TaxID=408067 RepID=UPI00248CBDDF|nr:PaaI family thioesterase [Yinghuangia seranimata]MDI2128575.1 PaaI family thioesterase [Yinghuangia seranimata]
MSTLEPLPAANDEPPAWAPGVPEVPADVLAELRGTWTPRPDPDSAGRAARHRLAEATRRLIEAAKTIDPEGDADALGSVADEVSDLAARIAAMPSLRDRTPSLADIQLHERSPFVGAANPLAPPMELAADGPVIRAHAVFGEAYEGPNGRVHGGYVAAAFDEVMGVAQSGAGALGMTAYLTVRMRRGTPLHERVDYEAEVVRVEGRKAWVEARSYAGGVLVADAEGLFIRARSV